MYKTKLLLIVALFSSSLNAMDNKRKQDFSDNNSEIKKVKVAPEITPENVTPPLHAVLWGKISSYLPHKDQMSMRPLTKSIKYQVDLNTHSIEIKGNLTNLASLTSYLSNETLSIKQVQFTGEWTSFSVFQTIAEKIGGNLISLKGFHNDMFCMFKENQCFDKLFPNLSILHVFNDCPKNNNEKRGDDIFYKPNDWTILHELPPALKEVEYKESAEHNIPYGDDEMLDLDLDATKKGLETLFKRQNIETIALSLEDDSLSLKCLPESVKNLSLTCPADWNEKILETLLDISIHKNLISLALCGFPIDEIEDDVVLPKNIQKLHLDNCLIVDQEIFDAISHLPYLKKLKLTNTRLDVNTDLSLNIPNVEELTIAFSSDFSTEEDVDIIIKTSCEKMNLTPLDNIKFQINK